MILVAGEIQIAPGTFAKLKPAMEAMLKATRAEKGCVAYSYAQDVLNPDIIRIFEKWESKAELKDHTLTDHIKVWRAALAEAKIVSRNLQSYEVENMQDV